MLIPATEVIVKIERKLILCSTLSDDVSNENSFCFFNKFNDFSGIPENLIELRFQTKPVKSKIKHCLGASGVPAKD